MIPNTSNVSSPQGAGSGGRIFKKDDFIVVNFERQRYPGRVTAIEPDGHIISTMKKTQKNWRWPDHKDAILYSKEQILYSMEFSRPVGKRGIFEVKDLD